MRNIKLNVGNKEIGKALTWAYPYGQSFGYFTIPTYELKVSGTDDTGMPKSQAFEVFRFGVKCDHGGSPHVVGLADFQTHVIKAWLPHYRVHSAVSLEQGAWQVYGNFLIHDGPDDPKSKPMLPSDALRFVKDRRVLTGSTILLLAFPVQGSPRERKNLRISADPRV